MPRRGRVPSTRCDTRLRYRPLVRFCATAHLAMLCGREWATYGPTLKSTPSMAKASVRLACFLTPWLFSLVSLFAWFGLPCFLSPWQTVLFFLISSFLLHSLSLASCTFVQPLFTPRSIIFCSKGADEMVPCGSRQRQCWNSGDQAVHAATQVQRHLQSTQAAEPHGQGQAGPARHPVGRRPQAPPCPGLLLLNFSSSHSSLSLLLVCVGVVSQYRGTSNEGLRSGGLLLPLQSGRADQAGLGSCFNHEGRVMEGRGVVVCRTMVRPACPRKKRSGAPPPILSFLILPCDN